jgi:hypothetical protein
MTGSRYDRGKLPRPVRCGGRCRAVTRGVREGVPGMNPGAYPSASPRFRAMPGHSRSPKGERSHVRGNADYCRPSCRDGRAVYHAPGGGVFHCGVRAQALAIEAFRVDVVDELVTKFQRQQEQCSRLEKSGARVCDLILGPPSGRVQLAN